MYNKSQFGATFSHPHLEYLKIPLEFALEESLKQNFTYLRLGAYWNRIEKNPNQYDFAELIYLLNFFAKNKQKIILTLGVKAPRWPEFYWPDFIEQKSTTSPETQEKILKFIKKVIEATKHFSCITHYQVDNEPFDPIGTENLCISVSFLIQVIELVRKLDRRPIILTLWGNAVMSRGFFKKAEELADIIGLDLYYKQFIAQVFGKNYYKGPNQSDSALEKLINSSTKPVWITELQAEPWEKDEQGYLSKNPESMNSEQLQKNIERAQKLPVQEILLWGFEYWLGQKRQGDRGLDLFAVNYDKDLLKSDSTD